MIEAICWDVGGVFSARPLERGELPLVDAWVEVERAVAELGIGLALADFFRQFRTDEADRQVVTDTALELHAQGIASWASPRRERCSSMT